MIVSDLHFGEVVGDDEQLGGTEAGRHRLADVDVARNHDPVDRRVNGATGQVNLGLAQRAFVDFHVGFRLVQFGDGFVVVRPGNQRISLQNPGPLGVDLGQLQRGLGTGQIALRLDEVGFVSGRIELRDKLAFFDR